MTDEQDDPQPWRMFDEFWECVRDGRPHIEATHADRLAHQDALCARVWREAQAETVRFPPHEAERADAAEARVAVLEEALEEVEQIARLKLAQARAALADVREEG